MHFSLPIKLEGDIVQKRTFNKLNLEIFFAQKNYFNKVGTKICMNVNI